jgi:ABC-type Fe3+-hydroxamate transport system substrate-binding protein
VLILPQGAVEPIGTTWQHTIQGYANNVVTLASSHAGHFGNLSAIDCVKGTSIKEDSCYIPTLKTALLNKSTVYVGSGATADKELIASLKPQIVFVGGMQSDVDLAQKLEESGIYCFYFGDFAESNYMGRAQWIELIGAFIGKEQQGQDFMKNNESQINSIISRASQIANKPKVLWFTYSSSVPHWNIKTNFDYVNSIVSAVGGQLYFPPESTVNAITLSNEDFLGYMMDAPKIIFGVSLNSYKTAKDVTYFNQAGQVDFATSPAFKNNDCYVVGYDWAQDTADALSIIKSMAICLYPDEFKDLINPGKIIKFKVS